MKIVAIFAEKLYAFQYDGEVENEYARLLDLWRDVVYLREYAKQNNITNVREFINQIREDVEYIRELFAKITKNCLPFEDFFMPLDNLQTRTKVLSLQKGKRYKLRIYAIKIDENLFVITGGAIKLVFKMSEHYDTKNEKIKLEFAKNYFQQNSVFDNDSFYELINEENED
jgi:hypothetical protein